MKKYTVTILGGGAWGSALACAMQRKGHEVRLWTRNPSLVEDILQGKNSFYLPEIRLPSGIFATSELSCALRDTNCILAAIPAQSLRSVLNIVAPCVSPAVPFVICSKGIEKETGMLLSHIVEELLPKNPVAVLSGPSFASDVACDLPTAVVIAAKEKDLSTTLALELSSLSFRCYSSHDVLGVEISGALKNVFALAAGIVIGSGLGESARAAMITRGFLELQRIAFSFGARPETVTGLSGFGDLFLTCSSHQSRNFSCGVAFAQYKDHAFLAEGLYTASVAAKISSERNLTTPILYATSAVLERSISIREAVSSLMMRPVRSEHNDV